MKTLLRIAPLAATFALLTGCIGSDSSSSSGTSATTAPQSASSSGIGATRQLDRDLPEFDAEMEPLQCQEDAEISDEGPRSYRVEMPSRVDGASIVFQVLEPAGLDCNERHPLILHGHGFGGSRSTSADDAPLSPVGSLVEAGYTVISIDQRGFGESGGTVRVLDPDFEGQDLVQIVDWAEANLDYLAYQDSELLLGGVGGSYGGGFQYLLYNVDPDQRIKAMVPEITWYDLTDSLNPGNVTKNYWLLFLSAIGDLSSGLGMDPFIRSSLLEGLLTNRFPEPALDFFHYRGNGYFFQNDRELSLLDSGNTDDFLLDPLTGSLPLTSEGRYIVKTPQSDPYPVDVLMWQSTRDNLFPLNDAYNNYKAFRELGGDVRLLTYPFGHEFFAPNVGFLQETLNSGEFYAGLISDLISDFDTGALTSCGEVEAVAATVAWFDEKLRGQGSADDVITSGDQICYTLSPGDSVTTPDVAVGGVETPIPTRLGQNPTVTPGPNPLPRIISLGTLQEDAVIAGIPTMDLTVSRGADFLDDACLPTSDPVLGLGSCDVILFAGIGYRRNGVPELIDEQVMPLRGLGEHTGEMTGIAQRLQAGDELVLMVYGQHPTHLGAFSRDISSWLVQLGGSVSLPLLSDDGQQTLSEASLQF